MKAVDYKNTHKRYLAGELVWQDGTQEVFAEGCGLVDSRMLFLSANKQCQCTQGN